MGAAIVTLQLSLNPGKNDKTVQFGTIRKFRSAHSNAYHASVEGQDAMVMAKDTRKMTATRYPTYGTWFETFMKGCHKRMVEVVKPDQALSTSILLVILSILEEEWQQFPHQRFAISLEGAFYVIGFCSASRGEELPLMDLCGTLKHWDQSITSVPPHIVVAILGRFKGEIGESYHLLPIVTNTSSGINNELWIGRLLNEYRSRGIMSGPLLRTKDGLKIRATEFEATFFGWLEQVQTFRPDLIPPLEDVSEEYWVHCSFRRGSSHRGQQPMEKV